MSARTVGLQTACSNTVSQLQVESMSQLVAKQLQEPYVRYALSTTNALGCREP